MLQRPPGAKVFLVLFFQKKNRLLVLKKVMGYAPRKRAGR